MAYLQNNDTAQTYYTIADQVGSPRVIVKRWLGTAAPVVGVYYNYHPFGGFAESYVSSSGSRMGFTGHELDDHGNFRFYYFGERYYNAGTGQFTSVDKASQFASGFGYGNDPIL